MIFDNLRMTDLKQGSNCLSHSHLGQGACFCLFSVVVVLFFSSGMYDKGSFEVRCESARRRWQL